LKSVCMPILGMFSGYILFRIAKRYNENKTVKRLLNIPSEPHSPVQYSEEPVPMLLYIDKKNPHDKVLMIKQYHRAPGIPAYDLIPIRFNTDHVIINDDQVYQVSGFRHEGKNGIRVPMNLGEWPKSTSTLFLKRLYQLEKQVILVDK
jgi:hypothetical protein